MEYDIKKIAELSALRLNTEEENILRQDIAEMIGLVMELPDITVNNDTGQFMEMRSDNPEPSYCKCVTSDEIMAAAPESIHGFYIVPKALEN